MMVYIWLIVTLYGQISLRIVRAFPAFTHTSTYLVKIGIKDIFDMNHSNISVNLSGSFSYWHSCKFEIKEVAS